MDARRKQRAARLTRTDAPAVKPAVGPEGRPEKTPLRGRAAARLLFEILAKLIEQYRKQNATPDLLGYIRGLKEGTIAVARIDGKPVVGVNSTYHTSTVADDIAAKRLRDLLIRKYPDTITNSKNIGAIPMDAVFHAETTLLLRAATANGGTLAGKTLEVLVEKRPCYSCEEVLPYIGLELGNPTVTFVNLKGGTRTMRDGAWQD